MSTVTKATIIAGSATILTARLVGADGVPIQQADVTSIVMKVFDTSTSPPTLVNTPSGTTLTIAAVIFDSLQTDPTGLLWSDDTGYNFQYEMNGATLTPGDGITYRVQLHITPIAGAVMIVLFELKTIPVYGD